MDSNLKRKNLRLPNYDYSSEGIYFVTICTQDRTYLFGNVIGGSMRLNNSGEVVKLEWQELRKKYPGIKLDHFIVMPNHIHGIIEIMNVGAGSPRPGNDTGAETAPLQHVTLGNVIAYYKYQSTKQINLIRGIPGMKVWQRNYHDKIIRDENGLNRIRQYILDNPILWDKDPENIDNLNKKI